MLTSQEAIAEVDYASRRIHPDRLTRLSHGHYLPLAEQMLDIYRNGIGNTRQQLHRAVETVCNTIDDCSARRIAAFIKLLDEVSEYSTDRGRRAFQLREKVFRAAAPYHPLAAKPTGLFESLEWEVKQRIARELKIPWPTIERQLFSDVIDFHPLKAFHGYPDGEHLLARYNVAQLQACLYRATRMVLRARADLKAIIQLIKLSGLMHQIQRSNDGTTRFVLDGPASVLRGTRRYGVAMARIIPGLLACRDWDISATVRPGSRLPPLSLQLSSRDGLSSGKSAPVEFDSEVEADLMQKWIQLPLPAWELRREDELLVKEQKVFLPDFVAEHDSGRRVYIEVIGFWTPEYLKSKSQTLQQFQDLSLIIIAQEDKRQPLAAIPDHFQQSILWYKTKIGVKQLHHMLEQFEPHRKQSIDGFSKKKHEDFVP